ncbi:MAG: trehalose-phosphatase [Propionibacteriales bacterium]|nr:trehalose-phosphatase [Propionibacteriales bacterium]
MQAGNQSGAAALAPVTESGRAGLAALIENPRSALLAFDFDGTLAPIVDDPAGARAHPDALPALQGVAGVVGRLAIISGRPVASAVEYGGLAGWSGPADLVVLGEYGLERWHAATGETTEPDPLPGVAEVKRRLPELLARAGAAAAHVEDKRVAVGVHTRRMPDPAEALDRLRGPLSALAAETGLTLEPGRFVLELRPPGVDKGRALRGLVEEYAARMVMYAGDDLGDLAAYDAVDALRAEGVPGLLVCSGSVEVTALAERADLVVDGPDGVIAVLRALADRLH